MRVETEYQTNVIWCDGLWHYSDLGEHYNVIRTFDDKWWHFLGLSILISSIIANTGLWLVQTDHVTWTPASDWSQTQQPFLGHNTSFIRAQQHLLRKLSYWKYFQTFLAQPNLCSCFLAGGLNNAILLFCEFQNFDRKIYYSFHLLLADSNSISEMKDDMKSFCIGNKGMFLDDHFWRKSRYERALSLTKVQKWNIHIMDKIIHFHSKYIPFSFRIWGEDNIHHI